MSSRRAEFELRGLTDDPPQQCSPTFAYVRCNGYTFSYSDCRHSAENNCAAVRD